MLQIGSATGNVLMVAQGVTDKLRWYFIHGPRRSRNDSNCIASLQSTNVHDDGLSPSVMKALATESRRHRGKAFFSSLCLRGNLPAAGSRNFQTNYRNRTTAWMQELAGAVAA